jgi:hypothetical protein
VESTSLECPFTPSTLPSFPKASLQTDADVSMRTSPRIGVDETVEAKVLAGSFLLEIRFVYDLKKNKTKTGANDARVCCFPL